jgi:hypothetical protein
MTFRFQKRRGIGNVITTLIILIASVVLGAGVIFFGGSMFQSNTQSESIKVSNVHSWVNSDSATDFQGNATTAFVVQNTGSKAVTISSITLRGIPVPTSLWHYVVTSDQSLIQGELDPYYDPTAAETALAAGSFTDGSTISLNQGEAAIVYLTTSGDSSPGNMTPIDSGNTYALQIQAGQSTAVQQIAVVTTNLDT